MPSGAGGGAGPGGGAGDGAGGGWAYGPPLIATTRSRTPGKSSTVPSVRTRKRPIGSTVRPPGWLNVATAPEPSAEVKAPCCPAASSNAQPATVPEHPAGMRTSVDLAQSLTNTLPRRSATTLNERTSGGGDCCTPEAPSSGGCCSAPTIVVTAPVMASIRRTHATRPDGSVTSVTNTLPFGSTVMPVGEMKSAAAPTPSVAAAHKPLPATVVTVPFRDTRRTVQQPVSATYRFCWSGSSATAPSVPLNDAKKPSPSWHALLAPPASVLTNEVVTSRTRMPWKPAPWSET